MLKFCFYLKISIMQILTICPGCREPLPKTPQFNSRFQEKFEQCWTPEREDTLKKFSAKAIVSTSLGLIITSISITALALIALPPLGICLAAAGIGCGTIFLMASIFFDLGAFRAFELRRDLSEAIQLKQLHAIEHYDPTKGSKPIALVIQAASDYNGSLSKSVPTQLESDYRLVTSEAEDLTDIVATINTIGKEKIGLLWIQAHGYPEGFVLSHHQNPDQSEKINVGISTRLFDTPTVKLFIDTLRDFPNNTPCILQSCSTGIYEQNQQPGLARMLSQQLPQLKIFAPKKNGWKTSVKMLKSSTFRISMQDQLLCSIVTCYQAGTLVGSDTFSALRKSTT